MHDNAWSPNTVRILLDGEARYVVTDATGRDYEAIATGPTASDLRERAEGGGAVDLVLDAVQLDRAIAAIDDPAVRYAMELRAQRHPHELPDSRIGDLVWAEMGDDRPGHVLITLGVKSVIQHERGRQVETKDCTNGTRPKCWRCMERNVTVIGSDCGLRCPALKDPAARPQRGSLEDWDVEKLVATQRKDSKLVPGAKHARNMEVPFGFAAEYQPESLPEGGRVKPIHAGCE